MLQLVRFALLSSRKKMCFLKMFEEVWQHLRASFGITFVISAKMHSCFAAWFCKQDEVLCLSKCFPLFGLEFTDGLLFLSCSIFAFHCPVLVGLGQYEPHHEKTCLWGFQPGKT